MNNERAIVVLEDNVTGEQDYKEKKVISSKSVK